MLSCKFSGSTLIRKEGMFVHGESEGLITLQLPSLVPQGPDTQERTHVSAMISLAAEAGLKQWRKESAPAQLPSVAVVW